MATCRDCGAMIVWVESFHTGRLMPLDWARVAGGNVDTDCKPGFAVVVTPDPTKARHVSHYATCRPLLARREAEKAQRRAEKQKQQKKQLGLFR